MRLSLTNLATNYLLCYAMYIITLDSYFDRINFIFTNKTITNNVEIIYKSTIVQVAVKLN